MSGLAVAVIEGEESRIRETFRGEGRRGKGRQKNRSRSQGIGESNVDSWTEGSQEVGTPEQRDTGILGQSYFGTEEDLLGKGNLVDVVLCGHLGLP